MKVVNVRINGMENPVGFDFETVCVSWKVRETSARRQQNVKIEIALTEDFSELLWTKEGKNLNSAAEKLEFEQSAYTRYYVRVTVTSDEGETAVSKPAYFETGKMDDPWMGKWITTKKEDTFHPLFIKNFEVKKKPASARLYICGLGLLITAIITMKNSILHLMSWKISKISITIQKCRKQQKTSWLYRWEMAGTKENLD